MKRSWFIAVAIVVASNAVALIGTAYNRSAAVERVVLTEAEVSSNYGPVGEVPTGVSLNWVAGVEFSTLSASPDELRAAGFDLPPIDKTGAYDHLPPERDVAVAFELGGPAYESWLAAFTKVNTVGNKPPETRLIAVAIGRDVASLRAAHPDVSHTLVLHGIVQARPESQGNGSWTWVGFLRTLLPTSIHVPRDVREPLRGKDGVDGVPHYAVTLAVGRRGEPWIEKIEPR